MIPNPTINFVETMRGQAMLVDDPTLAVAPRHEDDACIKRLLTTGQQQRRVASMIWQDLAVVVNTTPPDKSNGLRGAIEAGTVVVGGLETEPLAVQHGTFELLPAVENGERRMRYHLHCLSQNGARPYFLYGFKRVANLKASFLPLTIWRETTTLYVTVYAGETGQMVAAGIIHIHLADFIRQIGSFRSRGVGQLIDHLGNLWTFLHCFTQGLGSVYLVRYSGYL